MANEQLDFANLGKLHEPDGATPDGVTPVAAAAAVDTTVAPAVAPAVAPVGANPVGVNPVGANPVGVNPVGANPVGAVTNEVVDRSNDVFVIDADTSYTLGDRDVGDNGYIRFVQELMIRLGIEGVGEVDGVYGRKTAKGIQDVQAMFDLPRTGVLDQATQDAFNNLTDSQIAFFKSETEALATVEDTNQTGVSTETEETAPAVDTTVTPPAAETPVNIPPTNANNLTFRSEAVSSPTSVRSIQGLIGTTVDGAWGATSEAALKSFQEENGLTPTGNLQDPELVSWIEENVPVDPNNRATTDPYRVPTLSANNIKTVSTKDWTGEDRDGGGDNFFGYSIKGKDIKGTVSKINMGGEEREIIDVSDKIVGFAGVGNTMVPRVLVLHETDAVDNGKRIEYDGLAHFLNAGSTISTQWFVDQDGRIFKITPNTRVGEHAGGMNKGSLGIEVEGLSEEGGTPEAATEAAAWLAEYLVRTNPEITHVVSHHQVGRGFGAGKDDGIPQLNAYRERVNLPAFNPEDNVVLFNDFKQRALGN